MFAQFILAALFLALAGRLLVPRPLRAKLLPLLRPAR